MRILDHRFYGKRLSLVILFVASCVLSSPSWAVNWTAESKVSYIRTYDGVDFSIGLVSQQCENQKNYFFVTGLPKNETFYSTALAAFLSDKRVRISYQPASDGVHCIVNGIWILN